MSALASGRLRMTTTKRRPKRRLVEAPSIKWIEATLIDPETDEPFILTSAEKRFLRRAFETRPDGRLKHPELLYSGPKKSGKTTLAAMAVLHVVVVLAGPYGEGICVANDYEQASSRVYAAIARIVRASPLLAGDAIVTADKITFRSSGSTIIAIASDFAGAAGSNPNITVFDELWGFVSERSVRLWDEHVPPPTRKIACRLTVTYAGYSGESELLEALYRRGLQGKQVAPDLYQQPGMLCFWTSRFTAPWQTEEWREQMRQQLRTNAYLRLIENQWVTSESSFVELAWWDACVDPTHRPVLTDRMLAIWVGVDASTKRDTTAIVACAWDVALKKVRLVYHKIFQPTAAAPLDFELTVERELLDLRQRFRLIEVRYDPFQMQAVAQRLLKQSVPMVEFPQSVPNITEASTCLYDTVKGGNLIAYPDDDLRLAVQRAVAIEMPRGWKISKATASHKIDVVVALGMAALGAVQGGISSQPMIISEKALDWARRPSPFSRPAGGLDLYALGRMGR